MLTRPDPILSPSPPKVTSGTDMVDCRRAGEGDEARLYHQPTTCTSVRWPVFVCNNTDMAMLIQVGIQVLMKLREGLRWCVMRCMVSALPTRQKDT